MDLFDIFKMELQMQLMNWGFKSYIDTWEDRGFEYKYNFRLFKRMEKNYNLQFELDAAAKDYNTKCFRFLDDALHQEWHNFKADGIEKDFVDVWCNHPHSLNEEFIKRADSQHKEYNINICMIIPTNCQSMPTWHNLIESETELITENHPILKRPRFFKNGKKTKHPSRNAYRVIIWRKSNG